MSLRTKSRSITAFFRSVRCDSMRWPPVGEREAEQKGCRERLVWHLSCHRRVPPAVAWSQMFGHLTTHGFMKTPHPENPRGYRLSFIIHSAIGGLMLLLSAAGFIFESVYPQSRGMLAWGFIWAAVLCLFIASLHYSKYLSLTR